MVAAYMALYGKRRLLYSTTALNDAEAAVFALMHPRPAASSPAQPHTAAQVTPGECDHVNICHQSGVITTQRRIQTVVVVNIKLS